MTEQQLNLTGPTEGTASSAPKSAPFIDASYQDAEPAEPGAPPEKQSRRMRWSGRPKRAAQPQRVRRVGTFTLGLCLIAAGAAIVINAFWSGFDIVLAAKLAPLSLVLFGIEVVASSMFFAKDKLKYDLFGGFVCLVLVGASMAAAVLPAVYEYAGPPHYRLQERLSDEVYNSVLSLIETPDEVESVHVSLSLQEGKRDHSMTPADLTASDYLYLDYRFSRRFGSEDEFSAACRAVLDRLGRQPYSFQGITFSAENETEEMMMLSLHGRLEQRYSADGLERLIELH